MIATVRLPGFIGGSYRSEAIYADSQRCVNWYPEVVESGVGENSMVAYPTPGTKRFGSNPGTSQEAGFPRGMIELNGQVFHVIGRQFLELIGDGSFVVLGTIRDDGYPVSMAANNVGQIFIASGGEGYCYGVPEQINKPTPATPPTPSGFLAIPSDGVNFFGAAQVAFLDDFFIVLTPNSSQIQVSAINNGTIWNGAAGVNVALVQGQADHLSAIISDKEYLYLFGSRRSELWYNAGTSFPFQINPGSFMEIGIIAPYTLVQADNAIFWLSQDARGGTVFYRADGFRPSKVSTYAIEWAWQQYSTVNDAHCFSYQQHGHTFVILTFPSADATWVYDCNTKLWHERTFTDRNGKTHQWVASFHTFAFGQHLIQARQAVTQENAGQIYTLNTNIFADLIDTANPNGYVIVRDRFTPHIYSEDKRYFCNRVEVRTMTGIGLDGSPPIGTLPQMMLRISRDGGNTYGPEQWKTVGAIGNYMQRVIWNLGGSWRDGVLWIRCTDPVNWVLIDCYITGELGAN